jgi:hypothetical protein
MTLLSRALKLTDFGLNCYYERKNDRYTGNEIHTHKRVMNVGGKGLNLFYAGSYRDLKAGVTNKAQTLCLSFCAS